MKSTPVILLLSLLAVAAATQDVNCDEQGTDYFNATSLTCVCKDGWTTAKSAPQDRVYCNLYTADYDMDDAVNCPGTEQDGDCETDLQADASSTTSGTGRLFMTVLLFTALIALLSFSCMGCVYAKTGRLPICCDCCFAASVPKKDDGERETA